MNIAHDPNTPGVLIVEDQILIAMDLSYSIETEGYRTLGPCKNVQMALAALSSATPQAALLDINLGSGATSEPIADELTRLNIPFAFLTAYGRDNPLIQKFPQALVAQKPINDAELRNLLDQLIETSD